MNKILNKIAGIALGVLVAAGIFTSTFLGSRSISGVEAATGTYSRNQATYYTSDFTNKITSSQYGTTLLNTLHELMYETHESYNTYGELWTYTKETDYDIDNPDNITATVSIKLSGKKDELHIFLRGGYIIPMQDTFGKYIMNTFINIFTKRYSF